MMRTKRRWLVDWLCVGLCLHLWACNQAPGLFRQAGPNKTTTRLLGGFSRVKVGQKFQLWIQSDTSQPESITLTYSENDLPGITTQIHHGTLEIIDNNHFNWVRPLDRVPLCTLNLHRIDSLGIDGSAQVHCIDSLRTGVLTLRMNSVAPQHILTRCGNLYGIITNTGNIHFAGKATIFSCSAENGGWFDASGLNSDDAYIRHYTQQDCWAPDLKRYDNRVLDQTLELFAYGYGNIHYKQTPKTEIRIHTFGRGKALLD